MRHFINALTEGVRPPSDDLMAWVKRWVESSHQIEDQIALFDAVRDECERFLNVAYPAVYRGLSITDADAETLRSGAAITIPAHRLQSWTKSRSIAADYALPGHGGDYGVLVRKTASTIAVVCDITNVMRRMPRGFLSGDVLTDASREKEIVCQTPGCLVIYPNEVLALN